MMFRWLSRCKGIQAQLLNSNQKYLSSASSNEGPPGQSSKALSHPFEKEDEMQAKAFLSDVKKEADDKRKVFIEEEKESSYDQLKKLYIEQNMNRYDSQAVGRNLENETPFERIVRVLKNDFTLKSFAKFFMPVNMEQYGSSDFLIVGSGITASLLAYYLKSEVPRLEITVLEEDLLIGCEPLGINGESVTMQWNMPHYIKMANFAFDFYHSLPGLLEDKQATLSFTPYGSLLLSSSPEDIDGRCAMYDKIKWKYERLRKIHLQATFPWLNIDDVEEGVHGLGSEGWVDPWNVLAYVRRLGMATGVNYTKGILASVIFSQQPNVDAEDRNYGEVDVPRIAVVKEADGRHETIDFTNIVLASGLRNRFNSRKLHIGNGPGYLKMPLPLKMRKRFMFRIRCYDAPVVDFPLILDPSGVKIRREGYAGQYLCWRDPAPDEEPDVFNLDVDMTYFEEKIRPVLINRIPAFKNSEVESCWAGFIDVNEYDGEPIIGLHPSYGNVFLITGLGANEVIFSPAIAKASAEILLESEYRTVDCSAFLLDRVLFNDPIRKQSTV